MKIHINEEDLKYVQESIKSGEVLVEDLRRWFKEKWVDVSKKVDGKHQRLLLHMIKKKRKL